MPEPLLKEILESKGISLYGVVPVPERERWLPCRRARELEGAALSSVICFAVPYYTGPLTGRNLSRYACLRDYHQVVGEILTELCGELEKRFPDERFFPFCDDSPFPEKQMALECGLGCLGDNTLLLTRDYGSYVFLAAIASTKEFGFTLSPLRECLHCGRCAAACPGGALSMTEAGPRLDRSRCASSLTQQKGH